MWEKKTYHVTRENKLKVEVLGVPILKAKLNFPAKESLLAVTVSWWLKLCSLDGVSSLETKFNHEIQPASWNKTWLINSFYTYSVIPNTELNFICLGLSWSSFLIFIQYITPISSNSRKSVSHSKKLTQCAVTFHPLDPYLTVKSLKLIFEAHIQWN